MGNADFHRRWAGRLLRLAAEAKNAATSARLRLMAADSLEKAARLQGAAEEPPAGAGGAPTGPATGEIGDSVPPGDKPSE